MESNRISRNVRPIDGQSQVMKRDNHILDLVKRSAFVIGLTEFFLLKNLTYFLEIEFEFSKSLSSPIICPDDMDDSSCLAKHCSVFKISLL